jgi:hypothetical protein
VHHDSATAGGAAEGIYWRLMAPGMRPEPENDEAVVLGEELAAEAQDTNQGATIEAVLSVDSEI